MTLSAVFRADLRQTGRSWRLRGLGAAFVFFFLGTAAIFTTLGRLPGGASEPGNYAAALVSPLGLFCPLVGVLVGYRAIIGERVSGTIRLLLSLPQGRVEVVLGKLFSRITLVSITATLGATVGYAFLFFIGGSIGVLEYVSVTALAMLLQATFIAISIGLSAGSDSEPVVVAASLGSVLLFTTLWGTVVRVVEGLLAAAGIDPLGKALTEFAFGINPIVSFSRLTSLAVGAESRLETVWGEPWFAALVLLCWFTVPLGIGSRRFKRAALS